MDVMELDCDDNEFSTSYKMSLETVKRNTIKNENDSLAPKDEKKCKWKVGDCCRAIYPADNLYYEAKIISLKGDSCTVEILGYGDNEEVNLLQLKESEGKKARRRQIKASMVNYDNSVSESVGVTSRSASETSHMRKKLRVKLPANNVTMPETAFYPQYFAPPAATHYPPPSPMPMNLPFMPTPMNMSPVPPISNSESDPTHSLLSAWFMAGYYTGMYSARKENKGCQCCCNNTKHRCCN